MDLLKKINRNLNLIKTCKANILPYLKSYVQDKSYPLEERWKVFVEAGKEGLLEEEPFIQHWEGEVEKWFEDWLDGDIVYKYEEVSCERSINKANCPESTEEFINELKEQWMAKFIYSFKFDW
jgi:hypothetical protein